MAKELLKKASGQKLLTLAILLTVTSAILLLATTGYTLYISYANRDKADKLVVKDIGPDQAAELTSQFVYADTKTNSEEYYSVNLDLLLTYNSNDYALRESADYVSVLPEKETAFPLYATLNVQDKAMNDPISNRVSIYELEHEGVKKDEQGTVEGLPYAKISFAQADYTDVKKKSVSYKYILYREVGDRYIFVEITYPPNFNITGFASDMANSLNSATFSPEIEENVEVELSTTGVNFMYERTKWASSTSDHSAKLTQIGEETPSSIYLQTSVHLDLEGKKTLEELHSFYKDYASISYKEKGFSETSTSKPIQLNDIEYLVSKYQYEEKGKLQFVTHYTALTEDTSVEISIKVINSEKGDLDSAAGKIIETITYSQPQDQASLMDGSSPPINDNVLGTSSLEIEKGAIIGKSALVRLLNRSCVTATVVINEDLPETSGKTYTDLCTTSTGSGFFVTSDGHIVTNVHISAPNAVDTVVSSLLHSPTIDPFWQDLSADLEKVFLSKGIDLTEVKEEEWELAMTGGFIGLVDQGVIDLDSSFENYIEQEVPFIVDPSTQILLNTNDHLRAEVIHGEVSSMFAEDTLASPALALLKVTGDSGITFPSLALAEPDSLSEDQKVLVIGYPNVTNRQTLFPSNAKRGSTITEGALAEIMLNTESAFDLLQLDASIPGDSGGSPIFNTGGEVIGITTYNDSGILVSEIAKLLEENKISEKLGAVSENIELGINNYDKSYYELAAANFTSAKDSYPLSAAILDPLISIAKDKVSKGEDQAPPVNVESIENLLERFGIQSSGIRTILTVIGTIGTLVFGVLVLVTIILKRIKAKSIEPPVVGNPGVPPMPQTAETQSQDPAVAPTQAPPQQVQTQPIPPETPSQAAQSPTTIPSQPNPAQQPPQDQPMTPEQKPVPTPPPPPGNSIYP